MKIFISWSGEITYTIAVLLSRWLPLVMQSVSTVVSADEDKKGDEWFKKLMYHSRQSDYGIVCVSQENLNSPWLLFEAGAIATKLDQAKVCMVLIGDLAEKEIELPLFNFKPIKLKDKEDMRKLIQIINQSHDTRMLSSNALNQTFERQWPKLEDYCKRATRKIRKREKIIKPKTDFQLLEDLNGLCHHLAETMGAVTNKIEHINNNFLSENLVSFPSKDIQRA